MDVGAVAEQDGADDGENQGRDEAGHWYRLFDIPEKKARAAVGDGTGSRAR